MNINNAGAIGTGTFVINGGTIDNSSAAAITLSNNNAQTWGGDFTFVGSKSLNMGTGAVTLSAINDLMTKTLNFDAIVLGWQGAVPPGPTNTKNITLSSALNHVCFPSQPRPSTDWEARVDQLVHELEAEPNAAARKQKFAEVQRIYAEQLPEINLVVQKEAIAFKKRFGNLLPSIHAPRVSWNVEEIYIKR